MLDEALSKLSSDSDHQRSGLEPSAPPTDSNIDNSGINHQGSASKDLATPTSGSSDLSHQGSAQKLLAPPTYESSTFGHQGSTPENSGAAPNQNQVGNPIDLNNSAVTHLINNLEEQHRMSKLIMEQNHKQEIKNMTSQTQKLIEATKAQVELTQAQTSAYQEEIESLRNKMETLTQAYNALSHTTAQLHTPTTPTHISPSHVQP